MTVLLRASPAWPHAADEVRRVAPYLDPRDLDAIGAMPNPFGHAPDVRLVSDMAAALVAWRSREVDIASRAPELPHLSPTMRNVGPINLLVPLALVGFLTMVREQARQGFDAAEDALRPRRARTLALAEARKRILRARATLNALVTAAFAGTPAVFTAITLPRQPT